MIYVNLQNLLIKEYTIDYYLNNCGEYVCNLLKGSIGCKQNNQIEGDMNYT